MRRRRNLVRRSLAICLAALAAACPTGAGVVRAEKDEAPRSWLDVQPSAHAGLVGKRYVNGRYTYLPHGDAFFDLFDKAMEGYGVTLNHPVLLPSEATWLGIDAFASWGSSSLGGQHAFGPPVNAHFLFDSDTSQWSVGGTIYADPLSPIRPLVQIGATFSRNHTTSLINGVGLPFVDRETDLLLNAGFEVDLNEWLAARAVFDINTQDSISDSTFLGDLIAWPWERVFIRGGVIKPLDRDTVGGHIGAGVTF